MKVRKIEQSMILIKVGDNELNEVEAKDVPVLASWLGTALGTALGTVLGTALVLWALALVTASAVNETKKGKMKKKVTQHKNENYIWRGWKRRRQRCCIARRNWSWIR